MNFIYPYFLFALSAVSIPIIIHLFNFRRYKKIFFPSIQFLKEINEETTSLSKVKKWLVLLSRILAIIFLVLAFAQPYIKDKSIQSGSNTNAVSIYIDNTYSMSSTVNGVPLLELAKQKAKDIVKNYNNEDQFQIINANTEGKNQHLISKDEAIKAIDEITTSGFSPALSSIYSKQKNALQYAPTAKHSIYWFSDFQNNNADFDKINADTSINKFAIQLKTDAVANLAIDTCWLENPIQTLNKSSRLLVAIHNYSDEEIKDNRVTLHINKQLKYVGNCTVPAKSVLVDTIGFTVTQAGWNTCEIALNDNPIIFDDIFYYTFNVANNLKVANITEGNAGPYIDALFNNIQSFDYVKYSDGRIDYTQLKSMNCIVCNNLKSISTGLQTELNTFVNKGGSLVIFPASDIDLKSYNNLYASLGITLYKDIVKQKTGTASINFLHPILKNVFIKTNENMDMPSSAWYFSSGAATPKEENIIKLKDGNNLLSYYKIGSGTVLVSNAPLDKETNDLAIKAIFVPIVINTALQGVAQQSFAITLGNNNFITTNIATNNSETSFKLKSEKYEFIPEQITQENKINIRVNNNLQKAGIYELLTDNDKSNSSNPAIAFNYSRKESNLTYTSEADAKPILEKNNIQWIEGNNKNMSAVVTEIKSGITLWKYCIILSLLFLLIEILLLRFYKK